MIHHKMEFFCNDEPFVISAICDRSKATALFASSNYILSPVHNTTLDGALRSVA